MYSLKRQFFALLHVLEQDRVETMPKHGMTGWRCAGLPLTATDTHSKKPVTRAVNAFSSRLVIAVALLVVGILTVYYDGMGRKTEVFSVWVGVRNAGTEVDERERDTGYREARQPGAAVDKHSTQQQEMPLEGAPLLEWNHNADSDRKTATQIYVYGKHDHIGVYNPLCIVPSTERFVTFSEPKFCKGFNRTEKWLIQNCIAAEEALEKETNVENERIDVDFATWLNSSKSVNKVEWIDGPTILQVHDTSSGNIAHYSGRILMLQHILDNFNAYVNTSAEIENVVIVPTFHLMKRFLSPQDFDFWHLSLLYAVTAPSELDFGTLGDFLRRERAEKFTGIPRVELLHNMSLQGYTNDDDTAVCFRQAVVPAFWKSRFFAEDWEYPSRRPSLQPFVQNAPSVPRDSVRLRERVNALRHRPVASRATKKQVIFLDRDGSRRNINADDKQTLFRSLRDTAMKRGHEFEVVNFAGKSFTSQVAAVEEAAVAIGVHGANLVNTIFMPPLSVLIEVFPYMFRHDMYREGGGAGLKYFSYQLSTGTEFSAVDAYSSPATCIRTDHQCKVHYRDAELKFTSADISALNKLLDEALEWRENVESSRGSSQRRVSN